MRVCGSITTEVAQLTEGFSFAYLKELFLSSMMQWMAQGRLRMGEVMIDQAGRLREQMEKTPHQLESQCDEVGADSR